jgi:ATP/maltotriose-dependent transcriptional regulator MalT
VSESAICNLGGWLTRCDELDAARPLLEVSLGACREGDDSSLCEVLLSLAELDLACGRWVDAERELHEALEVAEADGQPTKVLETLWFLAPLEAATGRLAAALAHVHEADRIATATPDPARQLLADITAGTVAFHGGDAEKAVPRLRAADEEDEREHMREPGFRRYLSDLIEASIETRRLDEAEEALARLEAMGRRVDRPSALAAAARARVARGRTRRSRSGGRGVRPGAELVATGRTNHEVASELFMSPRTVEAHLTPVYRKLGVPSRGGIGRRLVEIDD